MNKLLEFWIEKKNLTTIPRIIVCFDVFIRRNLGKI